MATWTDSRVIENSSVGATTETQIGSTVQIPNNQNWLVITKIGSCIVSIGRTPATEPAELL